MTDYFYHDSVNASMVTHAIYPDASSRTAQTTWATSADQVRVEYHLDGSVKRRKDQRDVVHTYSYNDRRQVTLDAATGITSPVDDAVESIGRTYDALGRTTHVTSYDGTTTATTVLNEVKFTFDDLGRVTKSEQDHAGTVGGTEPNVQYTYDDSATGGIFTNGARMEKITYPDTRVVYYDYGTTGAIDDLLGRVKRIRETSSSGTTLVEYSHNGLGTPVITDYQQPDIRLDHHNGTSGAYVGFDCFGRVKDHRWRDYGASTDVVHIEHGYDYASNRIWRDDTFAAINSQRHDELYTYDALRRLTNFKRGNYTYIPPPFDIHRLTGRSREQDWTLDQLGNWTTFKDRDTDIGSTWDLDQDRDHNDANEIDNDNNHANTPNGITTTTGMNWIDPKHDAAGNMTELPQPTSLNDRRDLTYDAWNRLVKIKDGMTTVAEYEYDGLNRRIVKIANSETRHFFYSTGSQVLEERVGTSTNADIQYIWGTRYIDDLILRDRDTNTNGTLDERLYALQDANWNIIALTDETGTVKQRFQYTPYGSLTKLDPDFTGYTGTDHQWEYTYTSRRLDDETGLMYYRARYYHTELGRFIARDPIGYGGGINLYAYVGGRPLNGIDPTGKNVERNYSRPGDDIGENHETATIKLTLEIDTSACGQKGRWVFRSHSSAPTGINVYRTYCDGSVDVYLSYEAIMTSPSFPGARHGEDSKYGIEDTFSGVFVNDFHQFKVDWARDKEGDKLGKGTKFSVRFKLGSIACCGGSDSGLLYVNQNGVDKTTDSEIRWSVKIKSCGKIVTETLEAVQLKKRFNEDNAPVEGSGLPYKDIDKGERYRQWGGGLRSNPGPLGK